MATTYLKTEEIVKIQDEIIEKSGGHTGIINYGNLKATDKDIWVKLHKISQGEMNISQITNWLNKVVK